MSGRAFDASPNGRSSGDVFAIRFGSRSTKATIGEYLFELKGWLRRSECGLSIRPANPGPRPQYARSPIVHSCPRAAILV
jgi:hypothetical protein